jgi:elongator complex protein 4
VTAAAGLAIMSSFKRKTGSRSELPAGTKSSPSSPTTLLTSTGIPSLDDILGGGLAISCSLLILAPDPHSAYGQLVQHYFIAQGLASNQTIFVIDDNPRRAVDDCMWFQVNGSATDSNLGQDTAQDENIKIAWRYEHMRQFQTTVDVASNQYVVSSSSL